MGVTRTTHIAGDGPQPTKGQTVTIEYTGWLKDPSQPDNKGKQWATTPCRVPNRLLTHGAPRFDSSIGKPDFVTEIGVGRLIMGKPSPHTLHNIEYAFRMESRLTLRA